MKPFIAAAVFSLFAAPAVAAGLPYLQNAVNRTLPDVDAPATSLGTGGDAAHAATMPYEQYAIDRRLPNIEEREASSDEIRSSTQDATRGSPWRNDYRFIAPAE